MKVYDNRFPKKLIFRVSYMYVSTVRGSANAFLDAILRVSQNDLRVFYEGV